MPRHSDLEILDTAASFDKLRVDDLKSLVRLLQSDVPSRKPELAEILVRAMRSTAKVRELFEKLDGNAQAAVQEAVEDDDGGLDLERFRQKYGQTPNFGVFETGYRGKLQPTLLRLFFPDPYHHVLPGDLRDILEGFVEKPRELEINTSTDLPRHIAETYWDWSSGNSIERERQIPVQLRETTGDALHDVMAVLRLIDAGQVRVSDKLRRPTAATLKAISTVLRGGDFYSADENAVHSDDEIGDLTMKGFAWPMLVQSAKLAQSLGGKLQLTPAGRKATGRAPHEVIHQIWESWIGSTLLDEFNRVDVIKGQKGNLTNVAERRDEVTAVLTDCPSQKWVAIDELFRLLRVQAKDFQVARYEGDLYLCEKQYGSLGYDGYSTWELTQGRFVLAFLFEYAATLGLIDVSYVTPSSGRKGYTDLWGTDDLSCLSRYDGLLYFRINSLGAWCLGQADRYVPETPIVAPILKVLPNHDVVSKDLPLSPAESLLLDRYAERSSDAVWRLDAAKILRAAEEGQPVSDLRDFLTAKSDEPLPQTVDTFLADLEARIGQLRDCGPARLLECKDATVAALLASDRRLGKLCLPAGERHLVFRTADEAAFRRGLRELGYTFPSER